MKILKKITNGIIIVIFGIMHTQFAFSEDGFAEQFTAFAKSFYFRVFNGANELQAATGLTTYETHAAFWFFYFGIILFPLGLLLHSVEKDKKIIPNGFIITYLIVILIGCYMIPTSGMTFFMLPHAFYMLVSNCLKMRKKSIN